MKIVIHKGFGGFYIPLAFSDEYPDAPRSERAARTDARLIDWVERHPIKTGRSGLAVVDIPDDVDWEIEEYDGNEWVSEKHRRWM